MHIAYLAVLQLRRSSYGPHHVKHHPVSLCTGFVSTFCVHGRVDVRPNPPSFTGDLKIEQLRIPAIVTKHRIASQGENPPNIKEITEWAIQTAYGAHINCSWIPTLSRHCDHDLALPCFCIEHYPHGLELQLNPFSSVVGTALNIEMENFW